MFRSAVACLAVAAALSSLANAETKQVSPGVEIQIGVHGSLRKDCTPNPAPDIRILKPSSHGVVRLASATLRTNRFPSCPNASVPVMVVFYKANADAIGWDSVTLEVVPNSGEASRHTYDIQIE
jgi:hypothetical protein